MEAVTFDPHLLNGPFRLVEDLLSAALVHRLNLGYLQALGIVMHPKVDLHGVDELFAKGRASVEHLVLRLALRHLVINHVYQVSLHSLSTASLGIHLVELHLSINHLAVASVHHVGLLELGEEWVAPLVLLLVVHLVLLAKCNGRRQDQL